MVPMQGKFKKTDSAVKTTEAWWSFLEQLWEAKAVVIPLLGGAGLVTSALWNAIDQISKFGWAGWVLASIPAILIVGALAWCLNWIYHGFRIRKIRRDNEKYGVSAGVVDQNTGDEHSKNEVESAIDAKLNEFLATKISATFETHTQAHGRDVKLADLSDRAKAVEQKLELLTSYAEQVRATLQDRFDNVDYGFAAIYNREWHQRLFSQLETSYENLAQPVRSGAGIADDATWQKQVKKWQVDLEQWLFIADYYAMGAKDRITKIHDFMYDGEWTFDEEPLSANQVHRFKEASILWHNAKEEKPRIDKCLEYAAFHGPSKKDRNDAPPRPSKD